jgi:hypothetical protein
MKRTRSKSRVKKSSRTAAAAAEASVVSDEQTISAKLEKVMKSLAETAQKTSDPMELLRALLQVVPLNQRK